MQPRAHKARVKAIEAMGTLIASASSDGEVRVWRLDAQPQLVNLQALFSVPTRLRLTSLALSSLGAAPVAASVAAIAADGAEEQESEPGMVGKGEEVSAKAPKASKKRKALAGGSASAARQAGVPDGTKPRAAPQSARTHESSTLATGDSPLTPAEPAEDPAATAAGARRKPKKVSPPASSKRGTQKKHQKSPRHSMSSVQ